MPEGESVNVMAFVLGLICNVWMKERNVDVTLTITGRNRFKVQEILLLFRTDAV